MPAADKTTALREVRALAVIALPLAGAYLAEVAMVVITKIVAGKLGLRGQGGLGGAALRNRRLGRRS